MSLVAVFLPVGLMPGISGQFFKNFGFTVVFAVLVSLAVARMITPMIAAYFLKAKGHQSHGDGWLLDRYMEVLRWTLKHRWASVVAGAAALAMTVGFFMIIPQQFQPTINPDYSRVRIEMVPGTTIQQTEAVADRVAEIINSQPEVAMALEAIREGNANIFITLKEDREKTSIEFERALAPRLAQISDARVTFASQSGGFGTGRD